MKLGIIVVYLVSDDNEKLLEIHLNKIKENTTSSFNIYAAVNMLQPQFIEKLKQYDFVKQIFCEKYIDQNEEAREVKEHSHYLEQLIKIAIDDGMSHIAIMHPDSFPIKVGWEKYLANKLSKPYVLVSIFPIMSSCIFFHRRFYSQYKPSLLLNEKERSSPQWILCQQSIKDINIVGCGIGYGYKTYLENLGWHRLEKTNKGEFSLYHGFVFDDVIFHLGTASKYIDRQMSGYGEFKFYRYFRRSIAKILPNSIKRKIINVLPHNVLYPEVGNNINAFIKSKEKLINDPEGYLKMLRDGKN